MTLAVLLVARPAPSRADGAVDVAARYGARTAHVESVGTLFDDGEEVDGASGVLIGDEYVLTNSHAVLRGENYKALHVSVRLGSRLRDPLATVRVIRDDDRDLALVELKAPVGVGAKSCPMPFLRDPKAVPMGTPIFVMGYPVDQDLSITGGLVSNQSSPGGRWQTDALINPGNSGGPAFDSRGDFIGIAVAGTVSWKFGDEVRQVVGVNQLIPVSGLIDSPIYRRIAEMAPDRRCWSEASGAIASLAAVSPPARLSRTFSVSETKDDHPVLLAPDSRGYTRTFDAEPGYTITGCVWHGLSENHHDDLACNVDPGARSASFAFRLTSGPAVDRWRGWWSGSVTLEEAQTDR